MDDVLKQRLVGAAVLIALAVIFVPMLFDRSEDPMLERTLDSGMPESPLADREVRRIPLNPAASRQAPSDDERAPAEVPAEVMPTPEPQVEPTRERLALTESAEQASDPADELPEPSPQSTAAQTSESSTADEVGPADTATPVTGPAVSDDADASSQSAQDSVADATDAIDWAAGWRVQVASFGVEATAEEIAQSLQAMDQEVRIDRIVRGESVLYRIQTGPYPTREAAEQAMAMINESIAGISPVVRAPERDEGRASDVAPGFAVQVGSFTSQANAERLEQRLRAQGFETFLVVEPVGSRTIWRVRVGTVPTREAAQALLSDIQERAGVEGLLVSHP